LKQATNALLLLGDSSAIGACRSPGARTDTEEGEIVSLRKAGFTALPLRLVMSAPLGMTKSSSGVATIIKLELCDSELQKCPVNRKGTSLTGHQQL
jgi:hypothetical protein